MKQRKWNQKMISILMGAAMTVSALTMSLQTSVMYYASETESEYDMISQSILPGISANISNSLESNETECNTVVENEPTTDTSQVPESDANVEFDEENYPTQEDISTGDKEDANTVQKLNTNFEEDCSIETEAVTEPDQNAVDESMTETEVGSPEVMDDILAYELDQEMETETAQETEQETEQKTEQETIACKYHVYTEKTAACSFTFQNEGCEFAPGELVTVQVNPTEGYMLTQVSAYVSYASYDDIHSEQDVLQQMEVGKKSICVTSEEVSSHVSDIVPDYQLTKTNFEATSVIFPDGLICQKQITFEMPENDITILASAEYASQSEIRSIKLNADPSLGFAYGPDALKNTGTKLYINKYEVTIKTTEGDEETVNAYCLQPAVSNPDSGKYTEGTGDKSFQILDESGKGKNALIARGLYYLYGGPAWGKEINDINLKKILKNYGCTTNDQYYCMTHYLLSYLYDDSEDNWNAWYDFQNGKRVGVFNKEGKSCIRELADALTKLPVPVTELSHTKLSSTIGNNGKSISETITYRSFEENIASLTLPSGVSLITSDGDVYTGKCKISGGTSFHLEKLCITSERDTFTLYPKYGTDFTAMKLKQKGRQDVAFAYYNSGELHFDVRWEAAKVQICITKKDALTLSAIPVNRNYSFAGAEYSIYSDAACRNKLETVAVNNQGKANSSIQYGMGTYYVKETKVPDCGLYKPDSEIHQVTITERDLQKGKCPEIVSNEVPVQVQIRIQKIDADTGEPRPQISNLSFEGALYGIFSDQDCKNLIDTIATDQNGICTSSVLPAAPYWVREMTAPQGYLADEHTYEITMEKLKSCIVSSAGICDITSKEKLIRGNVRLIKRVIDINGHPLQKDLSGIGFQFTYVEDPSISFSVGNQNQANFIRTDAEGIASTSDIYRYPEGTLIYGTWEIREVDPPLGALAADPFRIFVDQQGIVCDYTVDNDQIASHLMIEKRDAQTKKMLPVKNVGFQIIDENGDLVQMTDPADGKISDLWRTDETGRLQFPEALPYGHYVLKEVSGIPEGYRAIMDLPFEISEMNKEILSPKVLTVWEEPRLLPVIVRKIDAETGHALQGAVFAIRTAEDICDPSGEIRIGMDADGNEGKLVKGTIVDMITTDARGEGMSKPLYQGMYTVEEISAPPGYVLMHHVREISVKSDKDVSIFAGEFENSPTKITITKMDAETKQLLKGAVLALYDSEGHQIETWTSEEEAHEVKRLPVGRYELQELSAPEGYETAQPVLFNVKDIREKQAVIMYDRLSPEKVNKETDETEVPQKEAPKTGDETPLEIYFLLAAAALAAGLISYGNRHHHI